jgi:hypothetical protein
VPEPLYCAPADRPLIMLHEAEPGANLGAPRGMEPLTVCGLPMIPSDLWIPVDRQPGDVLCPACALGEQAFEQLTLGAGVA